MRCERDATSVDIDDRSMRARVIARCAMTVCCNVLVAAALATWDCIGSGGTCYVRGTVLVAAALATWEIPMPDDDNRSALQTPT